MEIQQIITFFLFISFLFFLIHKLRIKTKKSRNKKILPPGPWRLPIIGSVHHLTKGIPHHVLKNLSQKFGPIMYLQLGEVPTIVVSSPHMAQKIMKTHDLAFASRSQTMLGKIFCYDCTDIAFSPYGEYWRHMRKLCIMELLSGKMVKSFSPIRLDELSSLVSSIKSMENTPINVSEKLFWFMNSVTCRSSFGKACKDQNEAMISLIHGVLSLAGGFELADLYPSKKFLSGISGMGSKLIEARNKVDTVLDKVIDVHRENHANGKKCNAECGSNEDLIDVFFRVMGTGELPFTLTNNNIKAVILDMFVAGSDTSSSTVTWALSEMMKSPSVMAKAQAEVREVFKGKKTFDDDDLEKVDYLKLVIKETLRLHPPTPLLVPRECREETEIDGYIIPVKSKVLVNVWAIGRDPESWEDSESFIPERFENSSVDFSGTHFQFLPFGAGRRTCPGRLFGLALVTLPLAHLLYNFNWTLPNGMDPRDLDMNEANGMTARRDKDLYLIATPYT
ncbi:premnaspirodiene oxygenase-like isoform X2 [Solanum tuberosum]|uniref:premnaspirodiene oxygenase-like isoform X2 n=1 Tax=Solanum tuberosum TaxID=4113 RepID=UPI00073A243A|nr:PREDICTED: premnaspirodiene oxygenase-like isoform X2 [Solanum tuberosum]